jgi:hypothetical protein
MLRERGEKKKEVEEEEKDVQHTIHSILMLMSHNGTILRTL